MRDLHSLEDNFKALQAENYSLREYIIHLQSRLIESQGDYPQPPPNVNLIHPHARHERPEPQHGLPPLTHAHDAGSSAPGSAPTAPMSSLQASAARTLAAAGLGQSGKHGHEERPYDPSKRYKDEGPENTTTDEEIIRKQLQGVSADGLPSQM